MTDKSAIITALVIIAAAAIAATVWGDFDGESIVSGISGGLVVALRGSVKSA